MVTTHFRKPLEGMASSRSLLTGEEEGDNDSALRSVSVDSNQNKQVIYFHLVLYHAKSDLRIYLGCKLGQTATAIIDRGGDLEIRVDHVARATFSARLFFGGQIIYLAGSYRTRWLSMDRLCINLFSQCRS
jgi:hypothetical protein